jgi:tetratricopeptide (TPR) repeat protein
VLVSGFVAGARALRLAEDNRTRAALAGLLGVLAAFAFAAGIDWVWELTAVGVIGIAALGLLAGAGARRPGKVRDEAAGGRSTVRRVAPRAALGALAIVVIGLQLVPLLAQSKIRASQEAAAAGDGRQALESARDARRIQPWAASPNLQLALVEEQAGNIPAARAAIADAIERDRFDWRLWLVSARLETNSGRLPAARAALRRARSLNPKSPLWEQL